MKARILLPVVTTLAASMASAQTQVGQVTLTPVQAAPQTNGGVKARPIQQPAVTPRTRATPGMAATKPTAPVTAAKTFTPQAVPEGSYNLTGKVLGTATRLPTGSKVILTVQDSKAPSAPLLQIRFGAAALPVPYQLYFTQSRLKADRTYFVQAKVFNAAGQLTHLSTPATLPATSPAVLNLSVQAAQ